MQYQFDRFVLDIEKFELTADGSVVQAEPQVIELLVLLIENAGSIVSKETIHETIWAGRYVSESALSSRVKSLRQILGDDGKSQRFIRTVHKKGFRFVGELKDANKNEPKDNDKTEKIELKSRSRPRILVLPFSNLSRQSDQEYFADAITTDIITVLSKHRWLEVVARNTSFGYKNKSISDVDSGLNVDYVVEGSVQLVQKRVRISCHLMEVNSGVQIWAERYARELTDVFALQDEITEMLVARIEPEIGFSERNRIRLARPANLAAWDCFHLGIYHFFKFTGEDNLKAQEFLFRSQRLDENFGDAFAWWAYAVILGMVYWETSPSQELLDKALESCNTALELDRQNATFFALRARVRLARCEYQTAITENKMAISLNPTFAAAHCGLGDSLAYEGEYEEALSCFKRAIDLSPNDPQLWAFLSYGALACIFSQDYHQALEWCNRALIIPNCQYWTQAHKAVALAYMGEIASAHSVIAELKSAMPTFSLVFVKQKLFYLKKSEQVSHYLDGLKKAGVQ